MQRLLFLSLLIALPLAAQNFSPSAAGIGLQGTSVQGVASPASGAQLQDQTSPATSTTTISPSTSSINNFITPDSIISPSAPTTTGPTGLDQIPLPLGRGTETLDATNTAPTPIPDIPEDTSLILTPAEETIRQAQESQIETGPLRNDTETGPGNVTGGAINGGAGGTFDTPTGDTQIENFP